MAARTLEPALGTSALVAIPVRNERDRIGACLQALDRQVGVAPGSLGILLFLNNCTDDTAEIVAGVAETMVTAVRVISLDHPAATAGWARRNAMDAAAAWLAETEHDGIILTTDADSLVGPDWITTNLAEIAAGADAVAGRIALEPIEAAHLPPALVARGALEARYEALLTELGGRIDPLPQDPWPNHWTASGASIAVRASAYRDIGGMPALAVGEDAAFIEALKTNGYRVRHAPGIEILTSSRLKGRALYGVADTIRQRCEDPDSHCDRRLEALGRALMRILARRYMRMLRRRRLVSITRLWAPLLGIDRPTAAELAATKTFEAMFATIETRSKVLVFKPLRPSALPPQIRRAEALLRVVRGFSKRGAHRADSPPSAIDDAVSRTPPPER